jgi:hypothetical protein
LFSGATNAAAQMKLFKTCLGDSDGNKADNVEVYNWDYGDKTVSGSFTNPHLIKLVDATQDAQVFIMNILTYIQICICIKSIFIFYICIYI